MARFIRVSFIFIGALLIALFDDMESYQIGIPVIDDLSAEIDGVDGSEDPSPAMARHIIQQMRNYKSQARQYPTVYMPSLRKLYTEYKRQVVKDYDFQPMGEPIRPYDAPSDPEFTYRLENDQWDPKSPTHRSPFAMAPSGQHYSRPDSETRTVKPELKRISGLEQGSRVQAGPVDDLDFDFDDSFSEPRQLRQNPNLAANKLNKLMNSNDLMHPFDSAESGEPIPQRIAPFPFTSERDIPTSLGPTSPRHQLVLQESMHRNPALDQAMSIYLYAMIAGIMAAATVTVAAFAFGWYTMQKKIKAAADAEYPAYGVTGPNPQGSPSGDRRLAHSAQLYHYQHQKQQIIAMENRAGVTERNGSVSDAESEDENEEGDYTVYECPGFATTGELEVKNPLFLDEPTPATPATKVDK